MQMTQVFPIVLVYILVFKILNDALFPIVMFSLTAVMLCKFMYI